MTIYIDHLKHIFQMHFIYDWSGNMVGYCWLIVAGYFLRTLILMRLNDHGQEVQVNSFDQSLLFVRRFRSIHKKVWENSFLYCFAVQKRNKFDSHVFFYLNEIFLFLRGDLDSSPCSGGFCCLPMSIQKIHSFS